MPQRASQRKFGKSLELHLAKQKKQKLKENKKTDVCRREKCIEKENVCFEAARRESIKEDKNIFFWWGLLHGPQQGPDRKKEKKTIRLGKGKLLPKTEKPSLKKPKSEKLAHARKSTS
jgi:hypothetical protein